MKKKENFWTMILVLTVLIGLVITTGGCPPKPDGGEGEGEGEIQIPNLMGQLQTDAQAAIVAAGLAVGTIDNICSDIIAAGRVISTNPVVETSVSPGISVDLIVSTGPCSGEGEIKIDTIEELQLIGSDPAYPIDGNYVLTQDIDASATANWNNGAGFKPIGKFSGVFNGQDYIITNLTINRPDENYVGLFSYVSTSDKVMNIGLNGGAIMGHDRVGGLIGINSGQLTNCYVTGTVTGYGYEVGGLIGINSFGQLTNCYVTGAVIGYSGYVGGLVGSNYDGGVVTNCYATGAVTGSGGVGGLVGGNYGGVVTNCYATGAVISEGGGSVGGLVGYNDEYSGGKVRASFWDMQTSGQLTSAGGGIYSFTADMTLQATFAIMGWDFNSVWTIEEGCTYPYLQTLISPFTGCVL